MQRPLAVLAAAACGLLLLSVVANLIAIQESSPARGASAVQRSASGRTPFGAEPSRQPPSAPLEPAGIVDQAEALVARMLRESALGALGEASPLPYTAHTRLLVESKGTGRWVTLTEVRAPCAAVDRALARVTDLALGRPDRCERWIETTAAVLESHGASQTSPREFLKRNAIDTSVRVLIVYAGWRTEPGESVALELVASGSAPVHPREHFMVARTEALDTIYRELKLGPYAEG